MQLCIFILGIIGMTIQAAFLREVLATFRGGELTIGVALLFWLLWTSVGSGILGRFIIRVTDTGKLFNTLFPWYGVCGYLGVVIIGNIPFLAQLTPGEMVPYDLQFITVALAFLPFNIMGGFLFTLGVKELQRQDKPSAGRAYTLEALGSALAGIAVSLILVTTVRNNVIALLCPLLALITSLLWELHHVSSRWLPRIIIPIIILGILIWVNTYAREYPYKGQKLLHEIDTKYGRLRVTESGEQITFYSDAMTLFSAPDLERSEYLVHIPMLAADKPRQVLVLGGGPGGVVNEVLKYTTVEQVKCVEIDPYLFVLAKRFLEEKWLDDPRVETVFADGRAFLEHTDNRFDVIIMNMPDPLSGITNRYYTKEFFELAASRLTDRGILGFSLTGSENYIPDDLAMFLASIQATLRSVFPSVTILPGFECRFLACLSKGLIDSLGWEQLTEKRQKLGIETSYVRDYFLRFTMSQARMNFLRENLDAVMSPSINSDTKPTGYFFRTIVQGNLDASRSIRLIYPFVTSSSMLLLMVIGIVFIALFSIIPGKGSLRRSVMATVMSVGMTEISLEVMAIIAYQSIFGFLYGRIALLIGAYMGGLSVGGLFGTRIVERGSSSMKLLTRIQVSMAAITLLWIGTLKVHSAFPGHIPVLEVVFYLLTALSGIIGGIQFPVADSLYRISLPQRRSGLGAIYGIDLAGSSAGALFTASLMIPVLGVIPVLTFLFVLNLMTAGVIFLRSL
ncbi:MAG TPA: fused MFS/spermidine synthase [Anaerolineae bacterium]|nr:fused MFS/spermidine synthase [Anaerolineae bacterium]